MAVWNHFEIYLETKDLVNQFNCKIGAIRAPFKEIIPRTPNLVCSSAVRWLRCRSERSLPKNFYMFQELHSALYIHLPFIWCVNQAASWRSWITHLHKKTMFWHVLIFLSAFCYLGNTQAIVFPDQKERVLQQQVRYDIYFNSKCLNMNQTLIAF